MDALADTRRWLDAAVIGLGLCPFAHAVHAQGRIRWMLSEAHDAEGLLTDLVHELQVLAAADPQAIDTTLLVHPQALGDFLDFNDFLDLADAALVDLGLEGVLQIASFHPQYRFADAAPDDIANHTNRSPHPTLHLLREDSVERALASVPDPAAIVERNLRTLRELGHDGWQALDLGPR